MSAGKDDDFFLSVTQYPGADDESEGSFSLSIYLTRRDPATGQTEVWGENGWPHILEWAKEVVIGFGSAAINHMLEVRVDPALEIARQDVWPRWCVDAAQYRVVVDQLIAELHSGPRGRLYPFSIWMVPANDRRAAELIEAFRMARSDAELWYRILGANVIRMAVDDGALTIHGAPWNQHLTLGWLRDTIDSLPGFGATTEWD
ncbi:MAG: hypothetical protein ABIZ70_00210 [Gemmatimonadales bacterium]